MANEDTALREVDQELAEERQWAMFRKYGPLIIGTGVLFVVSVGGWQFWNARQQGVAKEAALEFNTAVELLADDAQAGRESLQAIAESRGSGYGVLAQFHRAASLAGDGQKQEAVVAYQEIYDSGSTPDRLATLARLRAAYLALGQERSAVMAHLGELGAAPGAFFHHAREIEAFAAYTDEDYETALRIFRDLSIDLSAPETVRTRSEENAALAAAGKAGVNLTSELPLENLIDAVAIETSPDATEELVTPDASDDEIDAANDHDQHDHE